MANSILKDKKIILRCSNWITQLLFEQLLFFINEKKIKNQNINNFISALNQDKLGHGFIHLDLNDYFKTEYDLTVLKDLIKAVIDKAVNENLINNLVEERLRHFEKNIVD